jgi:hypothetical protein
VSAPELADRVARTVARVLTDDAQRSLDRAVGSVEAWHLIARPECAGQQHVELVVEDGEVPTVTWSVMCPRCGPVGDVARLELDA